MPAEASLMHSVEGQVVWNCCGHHFTKDGVGRSSDGLSTSTLCKWCFSGANYHQRQCVDANKQQAIPPPPAPPVSAAGQGGSPAGPSYGALAQERASAYGDPEQSHIAIGLAWEAVFRNRYQADTKVDGVPIHQMPPQGQMFPAEMVALMLAAFKLVRASRPTFHLDSYEDMVVYFKEFSQQWRQRDQT